MRKLVIKSFHFYLMQHKWGRKYIGGNFYYILSGSHLPAYWTDEEDLEEKTLCVQKDCYPEHQTSVIRHPDPDEQLEFNILILIICVGGASIVSILSLAYIITSFLNAIL